MPAEDALDTAWHDRPTREKANTNVKILSFTHALWNLFVEVDKKTRKSEIAVAPVAVPLFAVPAHGKYPEQAGMDGFGGGRYFFHVSRMAIRALNTIGIAFVPSL